MPQFRHQLVHVCPSLLVDLDIVCLLLFLQVRLTIDRVALIRNIDCPVDWSHLTKSVVLFEPFERLIGILHFVDICDVLKH